MSSEVLARQMRIGMRYERARSEYRKWYKMEECRMNTSYWGLRNDTEMIFRRARVTYETRVPSVYDTPEAKENGIELWEIMEARRYYN